MTASKKILGGFSAAVGVVALASMAWACTPTAIFDPLPVAAAPSGAQLTVTGQAPRNAEVKVQWNSVKGPVLARTVADQTSGAFAAHITIPTAEPGIFYLVLAADGAGVGRMAFELVATPNASAATSASAPVADARPLQAWQGADSSLNSPSMTARRSGPSLNLAVGLLAIGMIGLAAGSGAAVVSRRKATQQVGHR